MTRVGYAKGAATAVALSLLSACDGYSGAGYLGQDQDEAVLGQTALTDGVSGCTNLSPEGNALNSTGIADVRCGPQAVSPTGL